MRISTACLPKHRVWALHPATRSRKMNQEFHKLAMKYFTQFYDEPTKAYIVIDHLNIRRLNTAKQAALMAAYMVQDFNMALKVMELQLEAATKPKCKGCGKCACGGKNHAK